MSVFRVLPYLGAAASAFSLGWWWRAQGRDHAAFLRPLPAHLLPEGGVLRLRDRHRKQGGELVVMGNTVALTLIWHDAVELPLIVPIASQQATAVWSLLGALHPQEVHATFRCPHGSFSMYGVSTGTLSLTLEEGQSGSQAKRSVQVWVSCEDLRQAWENAQRQAEQARMRAWTAGASSRNLALVP